MYSEQLSNLPDLVLPPAPDSDPDHFDIYQNYEIEAGQRDPLKKYLKENEIGTLIQWRGQAVHQIHELGFKQSLPDTGALFKRLLMLPLNLSMSDNDVDYVCECVRSFYRQN